MPANNNTTYLGNDMIKPAGVKEEFTKEQLEEILKCYRDPIYFIRNYFYITNVDEGLVKFDLRPFQEDIIRLCTTNRFTAIRCSRQIGKTTTLCALLAWYVIFNESVSILFLAHKEEAALELLYRFQNGYENIPKWMQQGVVEWNKKSIELENGSRIKAQATSKSAGRSGSHNWIIMDEFAFVDHGIQEDFFTGVFPTISSGKTTKVTIISTPNGYELHNRIMTDALNGVNQFAAYEADWRVIKERDEKWKQEQIAIMGEDKFRQEHENAVLGSGATLFNSQTLSSLAAIKPTIQYNGVRVYNPPMDNHTYAICCDVAQGKDLDYSAFSVIDVTEMPFMQVAAYSSNKISPQLFPNLIAKTASEYNDAFILVELNDVGAQVADTLFYECEPQNMLYTEMRGRKGQVLCNYRNDAAKGLKTSKATKKIGCTNLKDLVESRKLIIQDADTIKEAFTFILSGEENDATYEADAGCNDDLMMSLVFFGWLSNQQLFKDMIDIDARQRIFAEKINEIQDDEKPFGFIAGMNDEDTMPTNF